MAAAFWDVIVPALLTVKAPSALIALFSAVIAPLLVTVPPKYA